MCDLVAITPTTKQQAANHEDELYDVIDQMEQDMKEKEDKISELQAQLQKSDTNVQLEVEKDAKTEGNGWAADAWSHA